MKLYTRDEVERLCEDAVDKAAPAVWMSATSNGPRTGNDIVADTLANLRPMLDRAEMVDELNRKPV